MHFLIQFQYQGDFSGLVKLVYSYDSCSVLWHCIYNMRNILMYIIYMYNVEGLVDLFVK